MGFRTERESASRSDQSASSRGDTRYEAASSFDYDRYPDWRDDDGGSSTRRGPTLSRQEAADLCGFEPYRDGQEVQVQRLVDSHGAGKVRRWADEGMTVETMGKPRDMEQFRERQRERPPQVPWNVERQNARSVQRSRDAHLDSPKAGDAGVPDSVRDVIGSPGRQLDDSIQEAIEERMGDSLGDVRIHTGPQAAKACNDINARAFTVGNHVAFNTGEYDPETPEGQHVLAHELAHVRQQTGGAVSMLPQSGTLEIDPDERLERQAEQTAERVMRGGVIGVPGMRGSDVHVQRLAEDKVFHALALFEAENESGEVGEFRESQNANRISFLHNVAQDIIERGNKESELTEAEVDAAIARGEMDQSRSTDTDSHPGMETETSLGTLADKPKDLGAEIRSLSSAISEDLDQIALTDDQREALKGNIDPSYWEELSWNVIKGILGLKLGPAIIGVEVAEVTLRELWDRTSGSLDDRAEQIRRQVEQGEWQTETSDSQGVGKSRRD
ncbi:DUF4157 domain-containing protein [Haloarcula sp. S1CR25-12]|uniref:DUF4157 domain-containing protein n=1 Tax=Haloarcula saliterrae TaxID=2950534 RepID=A0ABU2FFL0_9EURY|nr:DUF4157 domain-containing protein [Haloarcula sp. S1CR25-12]MDS0260495.1 DUF4157 domain-containing protein [Haloarcula sp. S1CR25-12]